MKRRELLSAGAAGLAGAVAGCSGGPPTGEAAGSTPTDGSGSSGAGGGGTPEGTPEPTPADVDVDLGFLTQIEVQSVPDLGTDGPTTELTYDRDAGTQGNTSAPDLTVSLLDAVRRYFRERPRPASYAGYAADSLDDPALYTIGTHFEAHTARTEDSLNGMANLVQGFDTAAGGLDGVAQYPVETLVERAGDSEDRSLLLLSVVRSVGYPAVLLRYPDADHMAVGVASSRLSGASVSHGGTDYYHAEAVKDGYEVGQKPTALFNQTPDVVPVGPAPSVGFDCAVRPPETGGSALDVELTVQNLGTAAAEGLTARVAFQGVDGTTVAERSTGGVGVAAGSQTTVVVPFRPADGPLPAGDRRQRLHATVRGGGTRYAVTSGYFSPGG